MDADQILIMPYVTEKTDYLNKISKNGQIVVFKVYKNATKTMIRQAVKKLYNVDVIDVKIINQPYKKTRFRNKIVRKPGFKKAILRIAPGKTIKFEE